MQNSTKTLVTIALLCCSIFCCKAQNVKDTTTSHLTAEQDLKEVTVSSKKPFIVLTAGKVTLNVAQSPIAASSDAYNIIKKAPGVTEQSGILSYKGNSNTMG